MNIKKLALGLIFVLICLGIGALGSISTVQNIANWYALLNKPFFTPPGWLFGPAWTLLYILMGIASAMVWIEGINKKQNREALMVFALQLFFNAIWTPVFFGFHQTFMALLIIIILWFLILWTILKFNKISQVSAWLLVPYILWVSFATFLNAGVWWLNR